MAPFERNAVAKPRGMQESTLMQIVSAVREGNTPAAHVAYGWLCARLGALQALQVRCLALLHCFFQATDASCCRAASHAEGSPPHPGVQRGQQRWQQRWRQCMRRWLSQGSAGLPSPSASGRCR